MEKVNFRTSSGIKSIVGRDLVTDKFVAIFELVKNGYDAEATDVVVSFNNFEDDSKQPEIIIADNGHGMNKEDLLNKWLYLAYSDKQEGKVSQGDRVFVGSKGIGRFSCDTLGELLTIRTKKADETVEHVLHVDWSNFERDLKKEFDQVNIYYSSNLKDNDKQYTILEIENLRHTTWHHADELDRTKRNLERLKNPFVGDDGFNIYIGQDLDLKNLDPNARIFNNISEILKDRSITLEAYIGETIDIELYDRGEKIYSASKENETVLKKTPILISIHYLNTSAKNMFTRRMGVEPVNYGNIFIYKNDFRVMPYGEEDYDLFGLNLRKGQGYNRYLGTREIIGYIAIQDEHHHFKEASSRNNGFVQNIYFETLENVYLYDIHMLLERYVNLIQWGENSDTGEEIFLDTESDHDELTKFKRYITRTKKFELSYFKDDLDVEKNNPEKQLDKIAKDADDETTKRAVRKIKRQYQSTKRERDAERKKREKSEEKAKQLEKQNENLRKVREPSSYSEQISHHFKYMAEDLYYATEDLLEINKGIEDKELRAKILEKISEIRSTQKELVVFQNLLINTDLDMRSKQEINWYQQAELFSSERNKNNYGVKISCHIDDKNHIDNWKITSEALQYQIMLDNFYHNAREHNATFIDIAFTKEQIIITNDSTPIDEVHLENIFNLGYSTKNNGTGIGLYQIHEFLKSYGYLIKIEQSDYVKFIIEEKD